MSFTETSYERVVRLQRALSRAERRGGFDRIARARGELEEAERELARDLAAHERDRSRLATAG